MDFFLKVQRPAKKFAGVFANMGILKNLAMAGAMAKVRGRSMSKEGARRREDKEGGVGEDKRK